MRNTLYFFLLLFFTVNITAREYHVSQLNPKAKDDNPGSLKLPFVSINAAAQKAIAGDEIIVHSGIYRERVAPLNQGMEGKYIIYKAAVGEKVIIKGSDLWKNQWALFENQKNIFISALDLKNLQKFNPFSTKLARFDHTRQTLGQIFVGGNQLVQVDSIGQVLSNPGTWTLSYDSLNIILHLPSVFYGQPIEKLEVEYTVRDKIFAPHKRGLGYIHVEGFTMEHCANQFPSGFYRRDEQGFPQAGALSTRSGNHWIIRNNTIRFAKNLGLDCGSEGAKDLEGNQPTPNKDSIGFHLIEYNTISDNGCGGIAGATQKESVIRYNIIERNNTLGHTAPETGAIKVHFFDDGVIEGNIIRDNYCLGIWLDNIWYGSRVSRNFVSNNIGHGIFVEMGNGPCLVDNNIIAFNKTGEGIYLHDASGVTIAHNLMYCNMHYGVYARIVTERNTRTPEGKRELVAAKNISIFNNIFIDNYRGHICLPLEDSTRVVNNKSDYNLFLNGSQWQWEGLGFNSFTIGNNDGRIKDSSLVNALKKAFIRNNYPDTLWPNLNHFAKQPLLQFKWWQMLTGNDYNSFTPEIHTGEIVDGAIAKGEINLQPSVPFLKIKNAQTFNKLKVKSITGIKYDYFGNLIDGPEVSPGPIQNIGLNNHYTFYLFPAIIK